MAYSQNMFNGCTHGYYHHQMNVICLFRPAYCLVTYGRFRVTLNNFPPKIYLFLLDIEQEISIRAYSHDVTAAMLVFQNNETAPMLVYQENPLGVELFSHVNALFCSNKFA